MNFKVEKMFRLPDAGSLKAFADVSCDACFVIRGVRIMEGTKGLFIGLPCEQGKDSKWYEQVTFTDADTYDRFSDVVLRHYQGEKGRNPC